MMHPSRGRIARALIFGAIVAGTPAFGARAPAPQDPPRPVFRSGASAVAVDVTVRDRSRRPITGLKAGDFQVLDNGVPQQIDTVSYGKLPIDITVALDVSHSVTGPLLDRLRQGVMQLMDDLGRDDRLKLILFNMRIGRTADFTRDVKAVERAIRSASAGGGTALFDAISVALLSKAIPDRRQLIVFFTDGSDSSSTTSPTVLTTVAQRSRATLAFVMPSAMRTSVVFSGARPGAGVPAPTTMTWAAPVSPQYTMLSALAAETGGSVLPVAPGADLSSTFRRVLAEFRSTYVLYYTPRNVPREGYHTIEVRSSREGASVQARRGYFGS